MDTFTNVLDTLFLLVIAASTSYIAYHYYRTDRAHAEDALYADRLALYRETVKFLGIVTRDGDISRQALQEFRATSQEGAILFDETVADYLDKLHAQASRLRISNEQLKSQTLPIGDERDRVTVENSKQLIWFGEQLPKVKRLFEPYLGFNEEAEEEKQD